MRVERRDNSIDVFVTQEWAKSAAIALICGALVLAIAGAKTAFAIFLAIALVTAPLSWYQNRARHVDRG